jgi:hypothetical protein
LVVVVASAVLMLAWVWAVLVQLLVALPMALAEQLVSLVPF